MVWVRIFEGIWSFELLDYFPAVTAVEGAGMIFPDLSVFEVKRLETNFCNIMDYHLMPRLTKKIFALPNADPHASLELFPVQLTILLFIGLQWKSVDVVEHELKPYSSQILALSTKILRKLKLPIKRQVGHPAER
jgi:tRNA(Met) C34 N-acetyltransferase TmcA